MLAQVLIEAVARGADPKAVLVLLEDDYEDKVRGLQLQLRMTAEEINYFRRQLALRKQSYLNLQREMAALRAQQGATAHKV